MGVVRGQTEHDQIGVHSIERVSLVRIIPRCRSLQSNVSHDFVFSFARHFGVAENNFDAAPTTVVTQAIIDIPMQSARQLRHERSSGTGEGGRRETEHQQKR